MLFAENQIGENQGLIFIEMVAGVAKFNMMCSCFLQDIIIYSSLAQIGILFPLSPKGVELDDFNFESEGLDCPMGEDLQNQKHPTSSK